MINENEDAFSQAKKVFGHGVARDDYGIENIDVYEDGSDREMIMVLKISMFMRMVVIER